MSKLINPSANANSGKIRPDFSYILPMSFGFILGLVHLFKYPIKLDEPMILDFLYFGTVQPDHYSLFYLLIRPAAWLFGDSTPSLRLLPFIFFLFSIHVFYRYLIFLFSSRKLAFVGCMLLILNSFFLNTSVYAYEYSMFFLTTIVSIFLFDKFLESGKNLGWLTVANILGLATFTMFYHVIAAELLILFFLPKTRNTKRFILANVAALGIHFSLITTKLLNFRFNMNRPETLNDRRFADFLGDAAGIDILSVPGLEKPLVAVSILVLCFYVASLLLTRRRFHLLLFALSVVSFGLFKLLHLREIEYRYYFYLTPVFIVALLQLKNSLSKNQFTAAISFATLLNITGLVLFLGFVKYGENSDLLQRLETTDRATSKTVLYTNNLWNYRHLVLPVYYRQFRKLPSNLEPQEVSSFTALKAPHLFILQFQPETLSSVELPQSGKILADSTFACSRCDSDGVRLLEIENHDL